MISLSSIINTFEAPFLAQYQDQILPSHRNALGAMKYCRTKQAPPMLASCVECNEKTYIPHSRVAIEIARTVSTMKVNNGWNDN